MPFQPINFANIAPQGNPALRDFIDNVVSGYKSGQTPAKLSRESQQEELANALSKLKLEQEPERFSTEMEYKRALLKKALSGAGGGTGGGMNLTKPVITSNQKIIQSIDNTLPLIDELYSGEAPGQFIGKYIHPNQQAEYEGKVSSITDALVTALNLPKIHESIQLVGKMVRKQPWENDDAYHKRLSSLKADLVRRRQKSYSYLGQDDGSSGSQGSGDNSSINNLSDDELSELYSGGG